MFFDPAIVATLKLREQTTQEDKATRAFALVPLKEKAEVERSRKQRRLGLNLKRQA